MAYKTCRKPPGRKSLASTTRTVGPWRTALLTTVSLALWSYNSKLFQAYQRTDRSKLVRAWNYNSWRVERKRGGSWDKEGDGCCFCRIDDKSSPRNVLGVDFRDASFSWTYEHCVDFVCVFLSTHAMDAGFDSHLFFLSIFPLLPSLALPKFCFFCSLPVSCLSCFHSFSYSVSHGLYLCFDCDWNGPLSRFSPVFLSKLPALSFLRYTFLRQSALSCGFSFLFVFCVLSSVSCIPRRVPYILPSLSVSFFHLSFVFWERVDFGLRSLQFDCDS